MPEEIVQSKAPSAEQLTVLMLFLESLIMETLSPDVLALAAIRTRVRSVTLGIDGDVIEELLDRMVKYAKTQQSMHPFAGMF